MKVIGFAGWSGSGKTTLVEQVIGLLEQRGLAVSLIKHAHHEFDIDHSGKDSHRHRNAGCREVLVTSARRWAMVHELRNKPQLFPNGPHIIAVASNRPVDTRLPQLDLDQPAAIADFIVTTLSLG